MENRLPVDASCGTLGSMFQISPTLRSRIDAVAVELIAVSKEMQDGSPTLAGVYKALGQGLDDSHRKMDGQHFLSLELPAGCDISMTGKVNEFTSGPAMIIIKVRE